jgi:hypothetical protein
MAIQEVQALLAYLNQKAHDGVAVDVSEPFRTADAIPFDEARKHGKLLFLPERIHRPCLSRAKAVY